jgi:hypothetical protein
MVIEIECKKCMKPKPIYKFFKANNCLNGYNEYCSDCQNIE